MTEEQTMESTYEDRQFASRSEAKKKKQEQHQWIYRISGALAAAVLLLAGVGIYATHKNVTIDNNGDLRAVSTWHKEPAAIVDEAHIHLDSHSRIANSAATIKDGDTVTIEKAKNVTVIKDGRSVGMWTFADSAGQIIRENKDVTAVSVTDASDAGLPLVSKDQNVGIFADGKLRSVDVSGGASVRNAVQDAGLKIGPLDRVSVREDVHGHQGSAKSSSKLVVKIVRVQRYVKTDKVVIKAPVKKQKDSSLFEGETKVIEAGQNGQRIKKTFIEKIDGKIVKTREIENKVTKKAKTRVIAEGTRKVPTGGGGSAPTVSGEGVWGALAACESGGRPDAVGGGGLYYGLYQFSPSTWASVGGSGLPSEASPEEQTMRAKMLQARAGWGQWPACSAKIGLR